MWVILLMHYSYNEYVDLRYYVEENPLSHSVPALKFIASTVLELTKSTYF